MATYSNFKSNHKCGFTESEILDRKADRQGNDPNKIQVHCPGSDHANGDRNPSATYFTTTGYLYCHSCGLQGFANDRDTNGGHWDYGNGYTKSRFQKGDRKSFKTTKPKGQPKPPPYGINLLNQDTESIYIVEGEKCTDTLNDSLDRAGHKAIAITSGGSTSSNAVDWQPVIEVMDRVAIYFIPDCDKQGDKYIRSVAKQLNLDSLPVIQLNSSINNYDIHDWITEGNPLNDLPDPKLIRFQTRQTVDGSNESRKQVDCEIDHGQLGEVQRTIFAGDRLVESGRFAYINHTRSTYDQDTKLWHFHADKDTAMDYFNRIASKEFGYCRSCRSLSKSLVYAHTNSNAIKSSSEGLLLVKTNDRGYQVIDTRQAIQHYTERRDRPEPDQAYIVRNPDRSDYLSRDIAIDHLDISYSELLNPESNIERDSNGYLIQDYPVFNMLTGNQEGQWQWQGHDYDFLIATLTRALFGTSGDRVIYLIAPSGAGKGTLLNSIQKATGNYSTKLRAREFVSSPFGATPLIDSRIVIFDEHISNPLIDKLNAYTDGLIQVERKFADPTQIEFKGLPILADVHLPSMLSNTGSERRGVIFENQHCIERNVSNSDGGQIKSDIVNDSAKPLLMHMLTCSKYGLFDHMQPPESIQQSTKRIAMESDPIVAYLDSVLEHRKGSTARLIDITRSVIGELKLRSGTKTTNRIIHVIERMGFRITGYKQDREILDCNKISELWNK